MRSLEKLVIRSPRRAARGPRYSLQSQGVIFCSRFAGEHALPWNEHWRYAGRRRPFDGRSEHRDPRFLTVGRKRKAWHLCGQIIHLLFVDGECAKTKPARVGMSNLFLVFEHQSYNLNAKATYPLHFSMAPFQFPKLLLKSLDVLRHG